jgi:hypothetical protein
VRQAQQQMDELVLAVRAAADRAGNPLRVFAGAWNKCSKAFLDLEILSGLGFARFRREIGLPWEAPLERASADKVTFPSSKAPPRARPAASAIVETVNDSPSAWIDYLWKGRGPEDRERRGSQELRFLR